MMTVEMLSLQHSLIHIFWIVMICLQLDLEAS